MYAYINKKQAFEYVLISVTFTEILEVESSELQVCIYYNLLEGSGVIPVIGNLNEKLYANIIYIT